MFQHEMILKLASSLIKQEKMPSTSDRQYLISKVLQSAQDDFSAHLQNMDVDDSDDEMHTSLSSGSLTLTSSSSSSLSSGLNMSVDQASHANNDDDDKSFMALMFATAELLETILKTQVINPNEVEKCLHLILVLVNFKQNDFK